MGRPHARPALAAAAVLAVAATAAALTASAAPAPTAVGVRITGTTALKKVQSPTVLVDTGTVSGSPVGSGSIRLVYTLRPSTGIASTTFTIANAKGTVSGTATSRYSVTRLHITFTGVGSITRGTRAYAGIRGRPLAFDAIHSVTGKRERIALTGRATLP